MNPIMQSLQGNSRNLRQTYEMLQDPTQTLKLLAKQNPMMARLLSGGNLQQTYYTLCDRMGVDPDTILNQLK